MKIIYTCPPDGPVDVVIRPVGEWARTVRLEPGERLIVASPPPTSDPVRDLLVALEITRMACEHSDGRTPTDEVRLARGMSVAMHAAAKHSHLIDDYQQPSFWRDVEALYEFTSSPVPSPPPSDRSSPPPSP